MGGRQSFSSFTFKGYQMNLLKQESYNSIVFQSWRILSASNDETHKIAYVYFRDPDLDSVDSMEEVLAQYCGWMTMFLRNML